MRRPAHEGPSGGQGQSPSTHLVVLAWLWPRISKSGRTYYAGRLGAARVLVLENTRKASSEDHDAELMVAPVREHQEPAKAGPRAAPRPKDPAEAIFD